MENLVALVTGASKAIGKQIARQVTNAFLPALRRSAPPGGEHFRGGVQGG